VSEATDQARLNKIKGVRACLIEDHFSAKQSVEDDNLNVLCLGGRIEGPELAWDLVKTFLAAKFSQAPRHVRRLRKVAALEEAGANRNYSIERGLYGG
jgi:ribose 5-phosphate isomerase B